MLQPLNAARLYATSLVERQLGGQEATLARNIDASLEAVEEILNVLIEISRLDTGRLEPDITVFPLEEVFERLEVEFEPLAREKGLELRIVPTGLWVRSDRRLLRRVLQNLAVQCHQVHRAGKVLLGVRRRGDRLTVQVCDTGPGIPRCKRALIFKEFERLEETAQFGAGPRPRPRPSSSASARCSGHRIDLQSVPGRGSMFSVELPQAEPDVAAEPSRDGRAAGGTHRRADRAVHRQRADVLNGMQALLERLGMHVLARAECSRGHRAAPRARSSCRTSSSADLSPRRRHGPRGRGGRARGDERCKRR